MYNGGSTDDIRTSLDKAWGRFWVGAGSKKGKTLPNRERFKDITRVVWPTISYRSSGWRFNTDVTKALDIAQRHMITCVLCIKKSSCEEPIDEYIRRRAHMSAKEFGKQVKWSWKVAGRILQWDGHLRRNRAGSWAGWLRNWKGDLWLQARRALLNGACQNRTIFAGTTETRGGCRGRPNTRYHDSVQNAVSHLQK